MNLPLQIKDAEMIHLKRKNSSPTTKNHFNYTQTTSTASQKPRKQSSQLSSTQGGGSKKQKSSKDPIKRNKNLLKSQSAIGISKNFSQNSMHYLSKEIIDFPHNNFGVCCSTTNQTLHFNDISSNDPNYQQRSYYNDNSKQNKQQIYNVKSPEVSCSRYLNTINNDHHQQSQSYLNNNFQRQWSESELRSKENNQNLQNFMPSSNDLLLSKNNPIMMTQMMPPSQMKILDFNTFSGQSSKRETPKFNTDNFKSLGKLQQKAQTQHNTQCHTQHQTLSPGKQSCNNCEILESKIIGIAASLDISLIKSKDIQDLIDLISIEIVNFKLEKQTHTSEKSKLQQDVERLLRNQDLFEQRVKEMDEVYALLLAEKEKLATRKAQIEQLINTKHDTLIQYQQEVKSIKDTLVSYKSEVKSTVEREVKEILYRKNRDKDYIYDYPLQINRNSKSQDRLQSNNQNALSTIEIKKRESDLDKKESQLYEWEAKLYEKKLKLDNQQEQLKGKVEKLTLQKQEISQNLKKLQILTQNYEVMLQKEYEISKCAEEIRSNKEYIETQKMELEEQNRLIQEERQMLHSEQLNAQKVDAYIAKVHERAQMEIEDNYAYIERERQNCQQRMEEAQEFQIMLQKEKERWAKGVEQQKRKLEQLVEEKKEQVQVMEVSMRQSIKEVREKQEKVEKMEKEFNEKRKQIQKQLEEERRLLIEEKERFGCLMLELEEKQQSIIKNNMPRQMPTTVSHDKNPLNTSSSQFNSIPQSNFQSTTNQSSNSNSQQVSTQQSQPQVKKTLQLNDPFDSTSEPQFVQQTPHTNKNRGMPPKPPLSTQSLTQSSMKFFKKEQNQKLHGNDLSLDQAQQLEILLSDNKKNQSFKSERSIPFSKNEMSLLDDEDEFDKLPEFNFNNKDDILLFENTSAIKPTSGLQLFQRDKNSDKEEQSNKKKNDPLETSNKQLKRKQRGSSSKKKVRYNKENIFYQVKDDQQQSDDSLEAYVEECLGSIGTTAKNNNKNY